MADSVSKKRIIALAGATASGKTSLGVAIAAAVNGEVISCDSMQVYRGMGIATAAPALDEMQGIAHHLVGYVEPSEEYSVSRFCNDAANAARDIFSRGKTPVLVGGTGLYMQCFTDNITFSGLGAGEHRQRLIKRFEQYGIEPMLEELTKIDAEYARRLHKNDTKRIIRALELYYSCNIKMSDQLAHSHDIPPEFDTVRLAIGYKDRQTLYDRINRRVDIMVENGLVDEARRAYERSSATAAQAIGHKELFPYFDKTASLEECIERLKMQTRRYAKRQLSFFRRDERIHWIYADLKSFNEILSEALAYVKEATEL